MVIHKLKTAVAMLMAGTLALLGPGSAFAGTYYYASSGSSSSGGSYTYVSSGSSSGGSYSSHSASRSSSSGGRKVLPEGSTFLPHVREPTLALSSKRIRPALSQSRTNSHYTLVPDIPFPLSSPEKELFVPCVDRIASLSLPFQKEKVEVKYCLTVK